MLLRALAISLAALGRIDAREPDPVLTRGSVEDGEGIAIGDPDDGAEKLGGRGSIAEHEQQRGVDQT